MGAGGLGAFYGAKLARDGNEVLFVARGSTLEAIRGKGVTVKTPSESFTVHADATDDPRGNPPAELVLFCVKTYDTEAAAKLIHPLVGPRTVVMSLQNGVDHVDHLGRLLGPQHVVGATSYVSARAVSPAVIEVAFAHKTLLGEFDGRSSERAAGIAAVLQAAGIAAEVVPDINAALWSKLVGMCSLAAVGCVTRLPWGEIHACPETAELRWGIIEEAIAVAREAGVALPADLMAYFRKFVGTVDPAMRPSMYYDLAAGRRLELDALVGVVVRKGAALGVPTPLTRTMFAALKPYAGGRSSGG